MGFTSLIFLIKIGFIAIGTKLQSLCPGWGSAHLVADCLQGHPAVGFDDQFIVDMHYDGTAAESLHGIAEDVTGGCLDNVLHELGTVAVDAFPFLCATDTFIGDTGATELVLTDLRFSHRRAACRTEVL